MTWAITPVPDPDDWRPGDPLHQNPHVNHQSNFFGFRYDVESAACSCPDAASWPNPGLAKSLDDDRDELGEFIAEWHEWRRDLPHTEDTIEGAA